MTDVHLTEKPSARIEGNQIITTHVVDAPREKVWEAWTQEEHLVQWWGPTGFTNTTHEINVAPGGVWLFVMHGPNGRDFDNKIIYKEVTKPERLVYVHPSEDGDENSGVAFESVVTFEDLGGKTRVTMRATFPSEADLHRVDKQFGAVEGGQQTIGRMAAYAANL